MRATVHICILSHLIEQCQVGKFARVIRYYMIWLVVLNYSHFRIWQSKYVILQEMRIDAAQMASSQNCLCQELEFYQCNGTLLILSHRFAALTLSSL